jgi:allene oxide cyclase-like protein
VLCGWFTPVGNEEGTMSRVLTISAIVAVAVAAAATVGVGLAQAGKASAPRNIASIHLVIPAAGHVKFNDFDHDGLTLGDTLTVVSPLFDKSQSRRVGTAYGECIVAGRRLLEGTPYDCTYVLKLGRGTITTQGLDPHGRSDVFFAITGGTGAYADADGQAEYIDSSVTDIIIKLHE